MEKNNEIQIVKIGSACLFDGDYINYSVLEKKATEIENSKFPTFVVVSGAIALGKKNAGDKRSNKDISDVDLMSYSSAGQKMLMDLYGQLFKKTVAQLIFTEEDIKHENYIRELVYNNFKKGYITLVNYNDCVDFKQLRKDNDTLAAQLLTYTEAKRLVILGKDYDGFCDADGKLITDVSEITDCHYNLCNGISKHGNGGFKTKLDAAKIVLSYGKEMIISNVRYGLDDIISGSVPRTLFYRRLLCDN